jgi:hypothetical protein
MFNDNDNEDVEKEAIVSDLKKKLSADISYRMGATLSLMDGDPESQLRILSTAAFVLPTKLYELLRLVAETADGSPFGVEQFVEGFAETLRDYLEANIKNFDERSAVLRRLIEELGVGDSEMTEEMVADRLRKLIEERVRRDLGK